MKKALDICSHICYNSLNKTEYRREQKLPLLHALAGEPPAHTAEISAPQNQYTFFTAHMQEGN